MTIFIVNTGNPLSYSQYKCRARINKLKQLVKGGLSVLNFLLSRQKVHLLT